MKPVKIYGLIPTPTAENKFPLPNIYVIPNDEAEEFELILRNEHPDQFKYLPADTWYYKCKEIMAKYDKYITQGSLFDLNKTHQFYTDETL